MLPSDIFTRPRRPWQRTIQVKHLLTDEDDLTPEQIRATGQAIAKILAHVPLFDEEIIANFEQVDDLDEFNSILEDMYDECDNLRVWVK